MILSVPCCAGGSEERTGKDFRIPRKVKLTERASPSSKKLGHLSKGTVVTVLEEDEWEGEEYVRCEEGWFGVKSPSGRDNLKPIKDGGGGGDKDDL